MKKKIRKIGKELLKEFMDKNPEAKIDSAEIVYGYELLPNKEIKVLKILLK